MIERVNETKLVYFMKENVLVYKTNTFSDLINIILEKLSGTNLCCTIFPKVDKPPEYFGIDDFSHLWFVISLGFSS